MARDDGGRRQYKSPPVVEAIARLVWSEPLDWGVTTPGTLFQALRGEYPNEPQARNQFQAIAPGVNDSEEAPSSIQFRAGPVEMVFANEPRTRLLIVSPTSISAHGLPPYEGWERLVERLFAAYSALGEVLRDNRTFAQASIRYINRVQIDEATVRISDYLTIDFALPPAFPTNLGGFLDRVEVSYPDVPVRLAFTFASTDAPPGSSAVILDLDLTYTADTALSLSDAREVLEDMKVKETAAFEGLLQDRARGLFDEASD